MAMDHRGHLGGTEVTERGVRRTENPWLYRPNRFTRGSKEESLVERGLWAIRGSPRARGATSALRSVCAAFSACRLKVASGYALPSRRRKALPVLRRGHPEVVDECAPQGARVAETCAGGHLLEGPRRFLELPTRFVEA